MHRFGGPDVLELQDVPAPSPGPRDVLIRVHAAGVNPADTYIRTGGHRRSPAVLPYIPGTDVAGVVESVGAGVRGVHAGARVYTLGVAAGHGGYADYTVARDEQVHALPDALSFEAGAAIGIPYATAYRALVDRARARAGETVLVHGASGGVGTAAVQIARARGLRVIGTAGSADGCALVRALGAHHVVDHLAPDAHETVLALTDGAGVDVVLEMAADVNLDHDLRLAAPGARIVVIGSRGRIDIDPRAIMTAGAAVLGVNVFNTPAVEMARVQAGLAVGFANGTLRPVVGRRFPLDEARQAHRAVLERGRVGTIVLVP